MTEWVSVISTIVMRCKGACTWLVEYFSTEGHSYLKSVQHLQFSCCFPFSHCLLWSCMISCQYMHRDGFQF